MRQLVLDEYEELASQILPLDSPHGYHTGLGHGHLGPIIRREKMKTILHYLFFAIITNSSMFLRKYLTVKITNMKITIAVD